MGRGEVQTYGCYSQNASTDVRNRFSRVLIPIIQQLRNSYLDITTIFLDYYQVPYPTV